MIKQEKVIINELDLVKTWSDAGKYVVQVETGIKYDCAIDIPNKYSYIESAEDIPLEKVEKEIKEE